jgi:hypothetical protein
MRSWLLDTKMPTGDFLRMYVQHAGVLLQYVKPKHQRIPSLAVQLKQDGKATPSSIKSWTGSCSPASWSTPAGRAALLLGIARRTLRLKLQELGLRVRHSVEANEGDVP